MVYATVFIDIITKKYLYCTTVFSGVSVARSLVSCIVFWFDPIKARTHDLPHLRRVHQPSHYRCGYNVLTIELYTGYLFNKKYVTIDFVILLFP